MKWNNVIYDVFHAWKGTNRVKQIPDGWYYRIWVDDKPGKPIGPFETDEQAMNHFDDAIAIGDYGRKVKTNKRPRRLDLLDKKWKAKYNAG
tara:strand:+ start:396 stop:668 length:273 start_codon:yes stop_codon:yes gene_type:complete